MWCAKEVDLFKPDLVASLLERGAIVWFEGDQLRYRAPKGVITAEDSAALKVLRDEVVRTVGGIGNDAHSGMHSRLLPLTAQQEPLWARIRAGRASYRHPCALQIRGALDPSRLELCVAEIIRRHDSLRTNIVLAAEMPWQRISADARFCLEIVDCSSEAETSFDQLVSDAALDITKEGLDMASEPLFAARLLRFSPLHHVLVWGIHHIVSDGFSSSLVFREVWTAYRQLQRGEAPGWAKPAAQYADYTLWQQCQLAGRDRAGSTFIKQFAHASAIQWPKPERPSDTESDSAATVCFNINDDVRRGLRNLALRSGTSLGITMMALYAATVVRQCQQEDIVITTAVTGRDRAELESMSGYTAHGICFPVRSHPTDCIDDVIARVRDGYQSALSQNIADVLAVAPLFSQSLFQWMPWDLEEHDGVPSAAMADELGFAVSRVHLPLPVSGALPFHPYTHMSVLWETSGGIAGCIVCQPPLLRRGFIQSFVRELQWQAAQAARP